MFRYRSGREFGVFGACDDATVQNKITVSGCFRCTIRGVTCADWGEGYGKKDKEGEDFHVPSVTCVRAGMG